MVAFFLEMMGLVKLIRPAGHSVLTCSFQMFVLFGFGQMYEYIVQYSASVEVIAYTYTVVTTTRGGGVMVFLVSVNSFLH